MPRYSDNLPSSTVVGAWTTDTISDFQEQLLAVTASLGMRLDEDQAHKLREIVDAYVFSAQDENNAVKVADARNAVDALQKHAQAFQAALNGGPISVRNEIDLFIEHYLADRNRFELRRVGDPRDPPEIAPGLHGPRLTVLADLAGELVAACEYARGRLTEHKGQDYYRPGQSWGDFINALAGWWEAMTGKRATASKSHTKQSPFVVFAFSIQRLLPPTFQQHMGGKPADFPPNAFGEAVADVLRQSG